jgi:hypothetical protein
MTESNEKYSAEDHGYTQHAGDIGAPNKVSGMTGASAFSLVLGVVALVWVLADARPFLAWLFATLGIVTGLRIFLPRVTTLDKVLITVGVLASLAAIVMLLLDVAS